MRYAVLYIHTTLVAPSYFMQWWSVCVKWSVCLMPVCLVQTIYQLTNHMHLLCVSVCVCVFVRVCVCAYVCTTLNVNACVRASIIRSRMRKLFGTAFRFFRVRVLLELPAILQLCRPEYSHHKPYPPRVGVSELQLSRRARRADTTMTMATTTTTTTTVTGTTSTIIALATAIRRMARHSVTYPIHWNQVQGSKNGRSFLSWTLTLTCSIRPALFEGHTAAVSSALKKEVDNGAVTSRGLQRSRRDTLLRLSSQQS